jgi:hypothetical protein
MILQSWPHHLLPGETSWWVFGNFFPSSLSTTKGGQLLSLWAQIHLEELLSITTEVFALLGTYIKIGGALKKLYDGAKSADTRIKALLSNIKSFVQTLRLIKDTLEQEKVRSSFETTGYIGNHWSNNASFI